MQAASGNSCAATGAVAWLWGADVFAGTLRPASPSPAPPTGDRYQLEQSVHLSTWRLSCGGWVLGWDPGSDAPPRQASPRRALEHYFHAVVTAVEQMASEPSPSRQGYLERLEEIYSSLLGPAATSRGSCSGKRRGDGSRQRGQAHTRWAAVGGPARGARRQRCTFLEFAWPRPRETLGRS